MTSPATIDALTDAVVRIIRENPAVAAIANERLHDTADTAANPSRVSGRQLPTQPAKNAKTNATEHGGADGSDGA